MVRRQARAYTMQLPFLSLTLTGAKKEMPKLSPEEARRRTEQRQKHLNIVKDRPSYKAYVERVPPEQRDPNDRNKTPVTPNPKTKDISRRRWQDVVNKWSWRLKELHFQHGGPDPTTPDPEPAPGSTTADTELVDGGRDYDSDEMAEDMKALALQGRPATPAPPMSYAELVAGGAPEAALKKRDWADYDEDEPLPAIPGQKPWTIVTPAAKKPAWASLVTKN